MTFIKLTARPNTWFKEGTEVFDYDADFNNQQRITADAWSQALIDKGICVRGIRITENSAAEGGQTEGIERVDGEWCSIDEFDAEIITQ